MKRLFFAAILATGAAAGCNGEECVEGLNLECSPLYEPTYANIFDRTFKPSCALAGSACHAAEGAQAGLIFDDGDAAYDRLLNQRRVTPGDASCSLLIARIESDDPSFVMPPGRMLPEAERCAIRKWIAARAPR